MLGKSAMWSWTARVGIPGPTQLCTRLQAGRRRGGKKRWRAVLRVVLAHADLLRAVAREVLAAQALRPLETELVHERLALFPSPADLPNLGIEPRSPTLQADSLPGELLGKP